MYNKDYLELRLKELETQLKKYDFLGEKLLDNPYLLSAEERKEFIIQNMDKIKEREKLIKEMGKIEWELMTPEQQKNYIEKYADD